MAFQGFTADGIPHMRPLAIPNWQSLHRPFRARFLSAGFLFAPGTFVREVPYDPELYFLGEEAAMTLRAFTHGYDLFHPTRPLCGTTMSAKIRSSIGTIIRKPTRRQCAWGERDLQSKKKIRKFLPASRGCVWPGERAQHSGV